MPCIESWNAWAVPWKLVLMVAGRSAVRVLTWLTASPSDTPGLRLKEIVTDGSWPEWLIVIGPVPFVMLDTALSGTSAPVEDCTYSIDRASGSNWYWGSNSMMTWYWLVGAKIVEICCDP